MKDIDYESLSLKQLIKYANKGDEWAQYLVGLEYCYPENDEDEDPEEAVKWFRKASDAGVPEASFELAQKMYTGDGIEENPEEAYRLVLKTANETDLPEAWALLGFMYGQGDPVEEDMEKCRELLAKAADMGSEYAQSLLDQFDAGTLFEDEDEEDEEYDDDEEEDEGNSNGYDGTDGFPHNSYRIDTDKVTHEAGKGNIHAIKTLAWGYYKGVYGLPENRKEGMKWYERGADMKDPWCLREYGIILTLNGEGRKALKVFERGIKAGSGDCCEKAGDIYFYGKAGISKDYDKAYDLYTKGSGMGHAGCTASIATMFYYGNGVRMNLELAKGTYLRAAEMGSSWSWKMAGLSAERQRHFEEARNIYLDGMEHGSWICACNLGNLYRNGRFGERNAGKCPEYYRQAVENGEPQGYACLGEVFHEMGEFENAGEMFERGAEKGNPDCIAWLGRMQVDEGGTSEGIQTIRNAVEKGSGLGSLFLGDYYYSQKNYSTALQYYHKAGDRNIGKALFRLGMMYYEGEGTPKKYKTARIYLERAFEFGEDKALTAIQILKKYGY